jgi:hypothetical protein
MQNSSTRCTKKCCNLFRRPQSLSYLGIQKSTMTDLSKTSWALKSFCSQHLKYSRLEEGENGDRESMLRESEPRDESKSQGNTICVALVFSVIFNVVLLYLQCKSTNLDRICSHYSVASGSSPIELWELWGKQILIAAAESPVSNDIDITYRTMRFNASFYKENIYRRLASPEVDEAWENLGPKCMWIAPFSQRDNVVH